jgi:hypothetical protein
MCQQKTKKQQRADRKDKSTVVKTESAVCSASVVQVLCD